MFINNTSQSEFRGQSNKARLDEFQGDGGCHMSVVWSTATPGAHNVIWHLRSPVTGDPWLSRGSALFMAEMSRSSNR